MRIEKVSLFSKKKLKNVKKLDFSKKSSHSVNCYNRQNRKIRKEG